MSYPPPPPKLGGHMGGRCKQVATTITNYCHADLLSSGATITPTVRPTITADLATITRHSFRIYYHRGWMLRPNPETYSSRPPVRT